jgi:hypothetical protein
VAIRFVFLTQQLIQKCRYEGLEQAMCSPCHRLQIVSLGIYFLVFNGPDTFGTRDKFGEGIG